MNVIVLCVIIILKKKTWHALSDAKQKRSVVANMSQKMFSTNMKLFRATSQLWIWNKRPLALGGFSW